MPRGAQRFLLLTAMFLAVAAVVTVALLYFPSSIFRSHDAAPSPSPRAGSGQLETMGRLAAGEERTRFGDEDGARLGHEDGARLGHEDGAHPSADTRRQYPAPIDLRGPYKALNLQPLDLGDTYQFRIPFVMHGGVPLIAVRVLSQPTVFVCVADTGSMELNLSGSKCARCDLGYGRYEHTDALDTAPSQLLVYGTQSDLVKEVSDSIQFHQGGETHTLPVCVTVERSKSQSNFNVFGLQDWRLRSREPRSAPEGILGYVMRQRHHLLVRFDRIAASHGVVASISEPAARRFEQKAALKVPLTWSDMGFFMTRLDGIRVGDADISTGARIVIWDTGSNLTSLPKATFARCLRGLNARRPITFVLEGRNEFAVEPANYVWKGSDEIMLDDDLDVLGAKGPGYIIMGAYCMQGYQFLFSHGFLHIAPSSFGAIELSDRTDEGPPLNG